MSTMFLLDLPQEILLQILEDIWPGDIENVSSSCRLLHNLAIPCIKEHNALKKEYGRVDLFRTEHGTSTCNSGMMLLHNILIDPILAHYPVDVRLHFYHPHPRTIPIDVPKPFPNPQQGLLEYQDDLYALLEASPFLLQDEIAEWHQSILNGNSDAIAAILLSLLPNISAVTIINYRQPQTPYLKRMIDRISNTSHGDHLECTPSGEAVTNPNPPSHSSLHNLHTLHFSSPYEQRRPDITKMDDCGLLMLFTPFPSLRTVAGELRCDFNIEACESHSTSLTSWIQDLTIECLDVATVRPLIRRLHHLRSLSLTERREPPRVDDGPILQWMLDDLAVAAGHSLEELRLFSKVQYAEALSRRQSVENLMAFEKLRVLDLDAHFLAGLDHGWESARGQVVPSSLEWLRLGKVDVVMEGLAREMRREAELEIVRQSKNRPIPHEVTVELLRRLLMQRHDDESWSRCLNDAETRELLTRFVESSDENLEAVRKFVQLPHLPEVMLESLFGSFENMAGLWPNLVELRVESEDKHVQEVCKKVSRSLWPGSPLRPRRRKRGSRTKKTEYLDTTPGAGGDPSDAIEATEAGR